MTNTVHSASSAQVLYGYESAFGTGTAGTRLFGKEQKITSLEFDNGQKALGALYTPEIESFAYVKNHGAATVEYILSNPWVLTSIFNDPTTGSLSNGTYPHTWTSDPATNTNIRNVKTMNIEFFMDGKSDKFEVKPTGVISPSLNIKTGIDQLVQCSQSLEWGNNNSITTAAASTSTTDTFSPYSFVHCTIKLPVSGSILATVQDVDITFDTGSKLLYKIDATPNASDCYNQLLVITGKINMIVDDKDLLQKIFDRTEVANLELKFISGTAGASSERSITITLTGIGLSKTGFSGLSPGELLLNDVDIQGRSCTIVARNTTATPPAI